MARSTLALCAVLAISGCGAVASRTTEPVGGLHFSPIALDEDGAFAPDIAQTPSQNLPSLLPPKAFGLGYFWVGYTGVAVGTGELKNIGSGDGFTFGTGFKGTESSRSFLEVVYEKTLKHSMPAALYFPDPSPNEAEGFDPPSGYHERMLFGGRTAAAAKARLEHQPRAYTTYGICYNEYRARSTTEVGTQKYKANGTGAYLGFGVEFPFADKASLSFDAKYLQWAGEDSLKNTGDFGATTFSLLWLSRF